MRNRVVVVRRRPVEDVMPMRPRREVVREVVRAPTMMEERRVVGPPRSYVMDEPPRRCVEPPRRIVAPPRREYMDGGDRGGDHGGREQWEIDLLTPQPGITVESVREVQPGDPKYDQYLHGQHYHRMEGDYREHGGQGVRRGGGQEIYDRPPMRVREREREPVYMEKPAERIMTERRPVEGGWRDNFRGVEYNDDDY